MAERMLVTQALDERDLLVKKIWDKIDNMKIIDTIKPNEGLVYEGRVTRKEFEEQAKSAYQQIGDLIKRYERIDAAITASNAYTKIVTSYGEFTVAGAIGLRSRLRGERKNGAGTDFERAFENRIENELAKKHLFIEQKNKQLQETAENMRLSILGKDNRVRDDKPLDVVDAYVRENTTELVDPLDARKISEAMKEKRTTLLSELDTQIKVSNATTFIEF